MKHDCPRVTYTPAVANPFIERVGWFLAVFVAGIAAGFVAGVLL